MVFAPHLKCVLSSERLDFFEFFKQKFPQPSLSIFTKGANIFGHDCAYIYIYTYI